MTHAACRTLLTDLVERATPNPMGGAPPPSHSVEGPVLDYLADRFAGRGLAMRRMPCGAGHESLWVALGGVSPNAPATLFETHVDTVPAGDWGPPAFTPRVDGDLLYGRGACDAKGCLAAMVLAIESILDAGTPPPCPLVMLAAGDEEYAQSGIRTFAGDAGRPLGRGVFGEPTGLAPVIQHKGTVRWDIVVHGTSAHTSRPELGHNAILDAMEVVAALGAAQRVYRAERAGDLMDGPTLTVTMIRGGRTRNAVPDECVVSVDVRVLPGMDPAGVRREVIERLDGLGRRLTHAEPQLITPPLGTAAESPFAGAVLDICRQHLGPAVAFQGAPYGTDASWMPGGGPALVLGPGDIAFAHARDERVSIEEVVAASHIYRDIMLYDWTSA